MLKLKTRIALLEHSKFYYINENRFPLAISQIHETHTLEGSFISYRLSSVPFVTPNYEFPIPASDIIPIPFQGIIE